MKINIIIYLLLAAMLQFPIQKLHTLSKLYTVGSTVNHKLISGRTILFDIIIQTREVDKVKNSTQHSPTPARP